MSRKIRERHTNVLNVVVNGTSIGMTRSPEEAATWLGKSTEIQAGVRSNDKLIIDTGFVEHYVPAAKV